MDQLHNNAHTILGTVIVVALLLQPLLGFAHHRRFIASGKSGMWTALHVWYGRILIIAGIVNGGLGLQLAANTMPGKIVYSVLGGLAGAAMILLAVATESRTAKSGPGGSGEAKPVGDSSQHQA
jgi:hypothetical protein